LLFVDVIDNILLYCLN